MSDDKMYYMNKWLEAKNDISRKDAEILRLQEALEQVHNLLMNMQPHIEQSCYPNMKVFIDNYVNMSMEIIQNV